MCYVGVALNRLLASWIETGMNACERFRAECASEVHSDDEASLPDERDEEGS